MRILFVCREQPWRNETGALKRNHRLITGLAREHPVTLVTFAKSGAPHTAAFTALREMCEDVIEVPEETCVFGRSAHLEEWSGGADRLRSLVGSRLPRSIARWESREMVEALRRLRVTAKPVVVFASRAASGEAALRAGFERVLVDLPDLDSEFAYRTLQRHTWYTSKPIDWAEWLKLRNYERRLPMRFWRVAVCKDEDRALFGRARANAFVIPNGTDEFPPSPREREVAGEILFVGHLTYTPNVDAVTFFHDEVFAQVRTRIPGARFRIVGLNPVPEIQALHNGDDCFVHGSVPDLDPFYATATVVVVPMRLGSGTKLKVAEGLARGKALVSTRLGAEGFDVRPGVDLEIADTPAAFADQCVRLLGDPDARARLGLSGRRRVLERYTWGAVVQAAEAAIQQP